MIEYTNWYTMQVAVCILDFCVKTSHFFLNWIILINALPKVLYNSTEDLVEYNMIPRIHEIDISDVVSSS
jgi:hypothetical protein